MHRVPVLWEIHKVHHSSTELDWLANWRFHVFEIVVYRSLLYAPLGLLGFSGEALFAYGVWNTVMGHFAHTSIEIPVGRLRYILNSPEMHLWHHVHASAGPINRNFGVTLSVWDWLFGTAYMPGHAPARLGFVGDESYARTWLGQTLEPFRAWLRLLR